ncbi:helix-turn-helix domain-containing protein [Metamycoplasma hominis]
MAKELNVTFATVNRWENARMAPTKKSSFKILWIL